VNIYIVPKAKAADRNKFGPKYLGWFGNPTTLPSCETINWQAKSYGEYDVILVAAVASAAQHTDISAQSDVFSFPAVLTANISAADVTTLQGILEAANLPAHWVTTSLTYKAIIRVIRGFFAIASRYAGLGGTGLLSGIGLDATVSQIPVQKRQLLIQAVESMKIDASDITGTMTIREALRTLAVKFPPFSLMGARF